MEKNTFFKAGEDNYMILEIADVDNINYLYTVKIDDSHTKFLGEYCFFKNNNQVPEKIDDEYLSTKLYDVFAEKYLSSWCK